MSAPEPVGNVIGRLLSRLDEMPDANDRHEKELERQKQAKLAKARDAADRMWRRRGERYRRCTLANYAVASEGQRAVIAKLMAYAKDFDRVLRDGCGVVLTGPVGTGKDHLLAGLAHLAVAAGYVVDWWTGAELWAAYKATIQDRDRDPTDLDREIVAPDVLIISDPVPPECEPSNYERTALYRIVDKRYSAMKATWLSLNARDRAEASRRLGAAVLDRITDGALSLTCTWESHRARRRLTLGQEASHD